MAFCGKCGTQVGEGAKFCPSCGAPTTQPGANQTKAPENDFVSKLQDLNNTADNTAQFIAEDILQNKTMAILAYLGPLVLIPLLAARDSQFARYHSNQGLILLIADILYTVIYNIVSTIIFAISWRLYFLVTLFGLVWLVFLALAIIGIVNAANGKAKELPVIGQFKILR